MCPILEGKLKPEMFVHAIVRPQVAAGGRVMDPFLAGKWICPMHPEVVKDQPGAMRHLWYGSGARGIAGLRHAGNRPEQAASGRTLFGHPADRHPGGRLRRIARACRLSLNQPFKRCRRSLRRATLPEDSGGVGDHTGRCWTARMTSREPTTRNACGIPLQIDSVNTRCSASERGPRRQSQQAVRADRDHHDAISGSSSPSRVSRRLKVARSSWVRGPAITSLFAMDWKKASWWSRKATSRSTPRSRFRPSRA